MAFRIVDATIKGPDGPIETAKIEWLTEGMDVDLDTLLAQTSGQKSWQQAADWLRQFLADGSIESELIFTEGQKTGFTRDQLYKAKDSLDIKPQKVGLRGKWSWGLPVSARENVEKPFSDTESPF